MYSDKYIKQLDSSKSEALKYLNMISWPQQLPENEAPYISSHSQKGSEKIVAPIVGGVGTVSLVGGLVSGKLGFTILGGTLLIGAIFVRKFQKSSKNVEMDSRVDYHKLDQSMDKLIYENVKLASDQWNSSVSDIHHRINQDILSSDMSEKRKTEMLSVASEEFPLLLSTIDISVQLQSLASNEDLSGMKKVLGDFHDKCIDELHKAYKFQLNVYKNLEN